MPFLKHSILKPGFGHRQPIARAADETTTEIGPGGLQGLRAAAAHRIRIGLTGLAAIFLVVLIAAAGIRPSQSMAAANSQAEPLAVLGVAPGAAPAK